MKRRMLAVLLILFVGICSVAHAADIPDATSNFFVNDFAGIFSEHDIEAMMEKAIDLDQNYDGIQVVVTTVKTIGNESLEVYANKMYNKYGIGKNDMGVLLLVVTEDRLIRAETGDMMQTYIPDSLIGNLMDKYAIPYLRENKFAEGMVSFQDAVIKTIHSKIKVESEKETASAVVTTKPDNVMQVSQANNVTNNQTFKSENENKNNNIIGIIVVAVFGLIILGIFALAIIKKNRDFKKWCGEQVVIAQRETTDAMNNLRNAEEQLEMQRKSAQSAISWYEELEQKNEELISQVSELQKENDELNKSLVACQDEKQCIYALHPNIDEEIAALRAERQKQSDMLVAESFDSYAVKHACIPASSENVRELQVVLNRFDVLSEEQRKFVKTDVPAIRNKYEESLRLKKEKEEQLAREAELREAELLKEAIEKELVREEYSSDSYHMGLVYLNQKYNRLSASAKTIFAGSLINALRERINQIEKLMAEEARREQEERRRKREEEERRQREEEERRQREEEERRRRKREEEERRQREEEARRRRKRTTSSSFSSSRSRSSFGGFSGRGGRSSGGGASGKF